MKTLASYQIKFKSFSGPFDVLLELIAARKLDICEVNLEKLTEDYIRFLTDRLEEGFGLAPDFIYVAAILLNIKASAALREELGSEVDELPLNPAELLDALKKLAPIKTAAASLKSMMEQNEGASRVSVKHDAERSSRSWHPVSAEELSRAVAELSRRTVPHIKDKYVKSFIFEIEQSLNRLMGLLGDRKKIRLNEAGRGANKRQLISLFFAALCLEADGKVMLKQPEPFADIEIEVLG